jgi:hypothetical protein
MAIKFDQRAMVVPFAGFAATAGSEATVLRELYAVAATACVDEGFFAHYVTTALLPATIEPWFSLGFGQRVLHGIRPIGGPDGGDAWNARAGIPARRAGPDECDAVHALIGDLMRHHAPSSIFMPFLPEAVKSERHEIAAWLSNPAVAYFLAEIDGEAVGVIGMHPAEEFVDELRRPDRSAYLYIGRAGPGARHQSGRGWTRVGPRVGLSGLRRGLVHRRSAGEPVLAEPRLCARHDAAGATGRRARGVGKGARLTRAPWARSACPPGGSELQGTGRRTIQHAEGNSTGLSARPDRRHGSSRSWRGVRAPNAKVGH